MVCPEPNTGCWLWTGAPTASGYGEIQVSGRDGGKMFAHRLAWAFHAGYVPDEFEVCHKCDVPLCVNPAHLFLGTHAQNMADMAKKKRGRLTVHPELARRGEKHHKTTVTEDQVRDIRARLAAGEPPKVLAVEFGITTTTISNIKTRYTWSHVK